jgi:hypothetical protein
MALERNPALVEICSEFWVEGRPVGPPNDLLSDLTARFSAIWTRALGVYKEGRGLSVPPRKYKIVLLQLGTGEGRKRSIVSTLT